MEEVSETPARHRFNAFFLRVPFDRYFTWVMRKTSKIEWLSSSHHTVANRFDGLSEK